MRWYSLSVSVCAGATVIESPVCTPIGSRFSIEQMMMQLSLRSRTTSISNSFQPITDSSISTSRGRRCVEAALDDVLELLAVVRDAAAVPPSVNDGRMIVGKPTSSCTAQRLLERSARCAARGSRGRSLASRSGSARGPRPCRSLRARRRSARRRICSSTPSRTRSSAQLSAVWPPIVGSSASGRSFSMIARDRAPVDRLDVDRVGHLRDRS